MLHWVYWEPKFSSSEHTPLEFLGFFNQNLGYQIHSQAIYHRRSSLGYEGTGIDFPLLSDQSLILSKLLGVHANQCLQSL